MTPVPHSPHIPDDKAMHHRLSIQRALCGLIAALGLAGTAWADDGKRAPLVPLQPTYQAECSGCHTAYPPSMLPAASWQRVMNSLPRHYGVDASLDASTVKEISAWLLANAGTYPRVTAEAPQDRISLSPWFVRKHHEVSSATWKLPAVKSAANCTACHAQAEQGDFSERNVRIPR
jgi:hypothetical protein